MSPRPLFLWLFIAALVVTVFVQDRFPAQPLPGKVFELNTVSMKFTEDDLAVLVRVDPTDREIRIVTYKGRVITVPVDRGAR